MVRGQKQSIQSPFSTRTESTLRDEAPSTKLVAYVLKEQDDLTIDGLSQCTLLPPRTVRYALQHLEEAELIDTEQCPTDARRKSYCWRSTDE
ncbi:MarR family transcriptional regulator [Natrinema gari]|uniref:ArsR family transcriptional regulator n=1 Tax=Natrinema gari JCM 14663 TaxID=1230459 RepID=L9YUU2_9EURY|nr:helix-turn-helix domain-containing protein [Natrinema gari]ELY77451.1 ArsR family transcriptional regulator [Natrinema gari JCM 14663]